MEQPLQLTILNYNISLVVLGILVYILVFSFSYWYQSKRDMKPIEIFDVVLGALFLSLFFARLFSVLLNFGYYAKNIWLVFDLFDKNFLYIGVFFGLIIGVLLISKKSKQKKGFSVFLSKMVTSYVFGVIPLLLLLFFAGKMLGMNLEEGGRMPVALFRIGYNILYLIIWFILRKVVKNEGLFAGLYIILFSIIEFILRIFTQGYSPYILNVIDLQQIFSAILFVIGLILFIGSLGGGNLSRNRDVDTSNLVKREKRQSFTYSNNGLLQTTKERFSLSYSKMQPQNSDLDSKEKIKILRNRMRRSFVKQPQ